MGLGVNVGFENTHALRSICANAPLQLRPTRTAYYLTCPPTFPSRITHEELGELDDNVSFVPCDPSSALNNKVLDARVTVIVIAIGPPVAPETSYSGTAPPTVRVMDPNNPLRAGSNSRRLLESRKYQLYVQSTRNNTITTFTDEKDNPVAWFSGGSCGFKKVNRASYEAGCQCAMRIFNRIMEERRTVGPMSLEFFFKGFGQGRDALQKAMLGTDGEELRPLISRVTDRTPLKIGGTRRRRLDRDGCTKYMLS